MWKLWTLHLEVHKIISSNIVLKKIYASFWPAVLPFISPLGKVHHHTTNGENAWTAKCLKHQHSTDSSCQVHMNIPIIRVLKCYHILREKEKKKKKKSRTRHKCQLLVQLFTWTNINNYTVNQNRKTLNPWFN